MVTKKNQSWSYLNHLVICSIEKYNKTIVIVIKFYNICTVVNSNRKCDPGGLNDLNI